MSELPVIVIGLAALVVLLLAIWRTIHNLRQPVRRLPARVVSRRTEVTGGMNTMQTSTNYYVTFEAAGDDRVEFSLSAREYGMLAEGDTGIITVQGTWYKGFERNHTTVHR